MDSLHTFTARHGDADIDRPAQCVRPFVRH
jgi:hypothetical protein